MNEPTSSESYGQAQRSGLIGQRQLQVLQYVAANGPCSHGDVGRHIADASSSFQPRFRELEDSGLIAQCGTKRDDATGRQVKAYVATGKVPTEVVRRKQRRMRATIEPAGNDLFRVTFDAAWNVEQATTIEFVLGA